MGGETWPGRSSEPGGVCTTLADAGDVTVMRVQGEVDLATVPIVRTTFGQALGAGPAESRCRCVRHDVLRSARSGGPHERCDRGCRAGNPLRGQWALTASCADMRDGVAAVRSATGTETPPDRRAANNESTTEDLRIALRRYRTFFDRLLSL